MPVNKYVNERIFTSNKIFFWQYAQYFLAVSHHEIRKLVYHSDSLLFPRKNKHDIYKELDND
jgi:hypothetical protein